MEALGVSKARVLVRVVHRVINREPVLENQVLKNPVHLAEAPPQETGSKPAGSRAGHRIINLARKVVRRALALKAGVLKVQVLRARMILQRSKRRLSSCRR
jgi:hypothetical protein